MQKRHRNTYELQFSNNERKQLIAKSIENARKNKGYKQKEVAELLKNPQQTYSGYEKGRNEPPAEILVRLSYLYNVSLDELMKRNDLETMEEKARKYLNELSKQIDELKEASENKPNTTNKTIQKILFDIMEKAEKVSEESLKKIEENKKKK